MMMRSIFLLVLTLFLAHAQAAVLTSYTFTGQVNTPEYVRPQVLSSLFEPNFGAFSYVTGTPHSPGSGQPAISATAWQNNDKYWTFTMSAGSVPMTLSELSYWGRATSTGPQTWSVYWSLDGYTAALDTFNRPDTLGHTRTVALSETVISAGNDITFRIAGTTASASGGAFRVDDIIVFGTSPIPEPGSVAMLGLGSLLIYLRRRKLSGKTILPALLLRTTSDTFREGPQLVRSRRRRARAAY